MKMIKLLYLLNMITLIILQMALQKYILMESMAL